MKTLDEQTRTSLERLVPRDTSPAAWEDVLTRAGVTRRARRPRTRLLALAAALAAAALAAGLSPWDRAGHTTVLERALAAMGDDPVLHAVIREDVAKNYELVDIASGDVTKPHEARETEIWYDRAAALGHTITRANGKLLDDTLQTPQGTTDMDGIVYTCAWIAAHPVEATREHVSCRFDGDNGTTPRTIPEAPPSVDPALAAFLGGYREQLANGEARKVGEGAVDGTPVYWVELRPVAEPPVPGSQPPPDEPPPPPLVERVAVDRATYEPLVVRSLQGDVRREYRVVRVETVPKDAADFSTPPRRPAADEVEASSVVDARDATPAEATAALGTAPLWLGKEFDGLPLAATHVVTLRTTYSRQSGLEPRTETGVELIYGPLENGHATDRSLVVSESASAAAAFRWDPGRVGEPPAGSMLTFGAAAGFGLLRRGELFVTLQRGAPTSALVDAARALTPLAS